MNEFLATFKVPLKIIQLLKLPKNAMGKVQKITLRESFSDIYTKTQNNKPSNQK